LADHGRKWQKQPVFGAFSVVCGHPFGYTERTAGTTSAFHTALPTGGIVTFQVGDKVIYPNHGLGIVERIEDKTILGTTCGFYHLRIVANETTVLVPVANVDGVGLRRAITDDEVERLFGLLGDGKIDNHQNWKGRFKDNSDKMRSGSIYDVADVLKNLTFLAKSKSLSFREKRMLDRAKFLIISEVSEVMRETAVAIEGRVDRALERSFAAKARTAAATTRAKTVKPAPRAQAAASSSSGSTRRAARAS
jgi:CarD family transcriptional regulator